MDETRYLLREFRDSDYPALATILNAVAPDHPHSLESLRHIIESSREFSEAVQFVVVDRQSDEAVASGDLFQMPFENDPATRWFDCDVLPGRRREGIGSYLFGKLLAEARRRGATSLRCTVREESASGRAFLAKRAFVERRRTWRSSLEVASANTSRLASLVRAISAGGIEITTLSREGVDNLDVLHRVYRSRCRDREGRATGRPVLADSVR